MPIDLGGGGGGASFFGSTLTATASGAIAAGDPLILNSNGTVSKPSQSTSTVVSPGERLIVLGDGPGVVLVEFARLRSVRRLAVVEQRFEKLGKRMPVVEEAVLLLIQQNQQGVF